MGSLAPRSVLTVETVYRAHARTVARWVTRLGGDVDVDDLVHDVFVTVGRRLHEFRGDAPVRIWLFRITQKVVANHRRRMRFRRRQPLTRALADEAPSGQADPGELLELQQARQVFYRVLDSLPEKYRTVLVLFELEGLTTHEVAELLGMNVVTVRVQLHRGRRALHDALNQRPDVRTAFVGAFVPIGFGRDAPAYETAVARLLQAARTAPVRSPVPLSRIQAALSSPRVPLAWPLAGAALLTVGMLVMPVLRSPADAAPSAPNVSRPLVASSLVRSRALVRSPVTVTTSSQASELELLRRIPSSLLDALDGVTVDAEGLTVASRRGFSCAADQSHALEAMTVGAAAGRPELVAEAWRAVDATFAFQSDEGHFLDTPMCVAYWMAHLSHALLLLGESDLGSDNEARRAALRPRLERAAAWLAASERRAELERVARSPGRMMAVAAAFVLSGELLGDGVLISRGKEWADAAVAQQRSDGLFGEDALATVYQAATLWRLAWIAARVPDARYAEALERGGAWLTSRIRPDGVVDLSLDPARPGTTGLRPGEWNPVEVTWSLAYHGVRFDPAALDAAARARRRPRAVR